MRECWLEVARVELLSEREERLGSFLRRVREAGEEGILSGLRRVAATSNACYLEVFDVEDILWFWQVVRCEVCVEASLGRAKVGAAVRTALVSQGKA